MKLFALSIGGRDRASSRLRVWDHLDWFTQQGFSVVADSLSAVGVKRIDVAFLTRLAWKFPVWIVQFLRADIVLVQETLILWMVMPLKNLGKRRRLVFDFSDPIDRIGSERRRRIRTWLMQRMLHAADYVVVENRRYLKLLAEHGDRVDQFYGPVDATRYAGSITPTEKTALRIGWTGSPGTLSFIEPLFAPIDRIARDTPIELMLIGAGKVDYRFKHARLTLVDWSEPAEYALVPSFDLGLFRLDNDDRALWRGAGKLFVYMAAGVPFIASDKGIASDVLEESAAGFAVARDEDWPDALAAAVTRQSARQDKHLKGLAFAAQSLSYEVYRAKLARHMGLGTTDTLA